MLPYILLDEPEADILLLAVIDTGQCPYLNQVVSPLSCMETIDTLSHGILHYSQYLAIAK
jgi:hypothetical protein